MSTVDEDSGPPPAPPCTLCEGARKVLTNYQKDGSPIMVACPQCTTPTTPEGSE